MSMNLIIDIGNSRVKYFLNETTYFNIDDLKELVNKDNPVNVFLVSTVPEANEKELSKVKSLLNSNLGKIEIFDPQQTELKDLYSGIGADRVAKLLGAMKICAGKDLILMDFGTATTATAGRVENGNQHYLDGYISLGLEKSFEALACQTSQLPDLREEFKRAYDSGELDAMESKSPEANIIRGVYFAHEALIDNWLLNLKHKLPEAITISTGGSAKFFKDKFDKYIPENELLRSLL